ncbi:MAG: hypothetical protein Q9227_009418 [Pyrenula ochraceoflavens]
MVHLTEHDAIAIALIVFYTPAFLLSILLVVRHGLSSSAGWRFMLTFTLARLLSGSFQLATINSPNNTSLYIGVFVLLNVAVSPLQLIALSLLSRLVTVINRNGNGKHTIIKARHIQIVMLTNLVGLILTIWGGIRAGNNYSSSGSYKPDELTKAGLGLFIFTLAVIMLGTVMLGSAVSHAPGGEKRIWIALAVSIPFLIVRMVYSAVSVFGQKVRFNPVTGSATLLLCVALIEEAAVVIAYVGVGVTLKKVEDLGLQQAEKNDGLKGWVKTSFGRKTQE